MLRKVNLFSENHFTDVWIDDQEVSCAFYLHGILGSPCSHPRDAFRDLMGAPGVRQAVVDKALEHTGFDERLTRININSSDRSVIAEYEPLVRVEAGSHD